jgi:chemotaxis protein methyltransferase WspC
MSGSLKLDDWLSQVFGLDPAALGPSFVQRAVHRRMKALGISDSQAYVQRAIASREERNELTEELVVPETWFFRDAKPFALLRDHAIQRAVGGEAVFRILSVPCASGEEPYSIALTLLEAGWSADRFDVLAVDISARSIERAVRGRYSARSLRNVDPDRRRRYFHPEGHSFALNHSVRRSVRFQQGNLLDGAFLNDEPAFDAIFCRNVLIYFTESARQRVVSHIRRLLKPSGILFVGHAERSTLLERQFVPVAVPGCFAYRVADRAAVRAPVAAATVPKRAPASEPGRDPPRPTGPAARSRSPERPEGASLLDRATEHAGRREYDEARVLCRQAVHRDGPSSRAYHLLGMIAQAQGDLGQAETWLGKAVFLDRDHADSLLALALLARKRGDLEAEARFRRRAERAHRKATL